MTGSIVAEISELVGKLRVLRYPTMLIALEDWVPLAVADLRDLAEQSGLRFVDYSEDVLSAGSPRIVLGAYRRDQFLDWLRAEARESGGIVVAEPDELISSWRDRDRRDFFVEFLHTESNGSDGLSRAPIVLASHLASRFSLPASGSDQGIVWSLNADT